MDRLLYFSVGYFKLKHKCSIPWQTFITSKALLLSDQLVINHATNLFVKLSQLSVVSVIVKISNFRMNLSIIFMKLSSVQ